MEEKGDRKKLLRSDHYHFLLNPVSYARVLKGLEIRREEGTETGTKARKDIGGSSLKMSISFCSRVERLTSGWKKPRSIVKVGR